MASHSNLTTDQVLAVFTEEVTNRGGRVTDTFHDGQRLFTRSVLPRVEDVRAGDKVQGGVALKATGDQARVWLYPYTFRLVCKNGAIMAETLASQFLGELHQQEPESALQSIRDGIDACLAPEVFQETIRKMRSACGVDADLVLNLMPLLSRLSTGTHVELISQIMERFFQEGDSSQFGLANAITATARDTRDPDLRWNLEEFGGGIAIGIVPPYPEDEEGAAATRLHRAVAVG